MWATVISSAISALAIIVSIVVFRASDRRVMEDRATRIEARLTKLETMVEPVWRQFTEGA